jgi:flagellar hook-length control protein FliK
VTTSVATESASPANASPTANITLDTLVSRSADAPVTPADARFELPARAEIGQEAAPRSPDAGTNPTAVTNTQGRAGESLTNTPLNNLPDLKAAPDSPDFPQEILGRLRMMQGQNGTEARLNLHPAELGRLQIAISSEGEATRVAFVVDNAQAKEALEQAMPRLREFLAQAGLQLADGSVSQQGQSSDFGTGDGSDAKGNALAAGESADSGDEPDAATQGGGKDSDRIFDAYA